MLTLFVVMSLKFSTIRLKFIIKIRWCYNFFIAVFAGNTDRSPWWEGYIRKVHRTFLAPHDSFEVFTVEIWNQKCDTQGINGAENNVTKLKSTPKPIPCNDVHY